MVELKGLFKLAPAVVIKYLKKKYNKVSWDWYDIWQEAHHKSFTVAKAMREDILQDIRDAIEKAISEGQTFSSFQKDIQPILKKKVGGVKSLLLTLKEIPSKFSLVRLVV